MYFYLTCFYLIGLLNYSSSQNADEKFGITSLGSKGFLITWDPKTIQNVNNVSFNFLYLSGESEEPTDVYGTANGVDGQFKIPRLRENEKYKIIIEKRELSRYTLQGETGLGGNQPPTKPDFTLEKRFKYRFLQIAFIRWLPCGIERNCQGKVPGTHFLVKIRDKNLTQENIFTEERDDYYEIYHLFAGRRYEVVVTSVNGDFQTDSDPKEVFIPSTSDPVQDVKVQPLNSRSVFISWKAPKQSSGPIVAYKVAYSSTNKSLLIFDDTSFNTQYETLTENLDELHTKLSYLDPDTKYTCYIIPKTESGIGTEYRIEFSTYNYKDEIPINKPELSLKTVFDEFYKLFVYWLPCGKNYDCKTNKPGSSFYVKYRKENRTYYTVLYVKYKDYAQIDYLIPGSTYEVIVTSLVGTEEVDSDPVTITIPQSDSPLEILEVLDDANVTIPCNAPRSSSPEIQWYENGKLKENYQLADLNIGKIHLHDRGNKYTCLDKNLHNATNVTTILVPRSQSVMDNPFDEYSVRKVSLGENVTLNCEALNDLHVAVGLTWSKDGKKLGGDFAKPIDPERMLRSISISVINEEALGNYTCILDNKFQQIAHTVSLVL